MQGSAPTDRADWQLPKTGLWAHAWKIALAIGVVGLLGAGVGSGSDPHRFAFSWLFAFVAILTLGLGALIFVIIQHLTGAHWSVSSRRIAELLVARLWVFVPLFVPVVLGASELYEWRDVDLGTLRQHVEGPEHSAHLALLEDKTPYLNLPFWLARAAVYFAIWTLIGLAYFRWSTEQDQSKDPRLTLRMRRRAPLSAAGFALSITFAGFDWVMSLEPTWYSTIFGVYLFAGAFMAAHALLIVITLSLKAGGALGESVNVEHYHDLGKMMFGFVVFWAYIGYSQLMLIWYANLPEEVVYYHRRWAGGWQTVSVVLVFGHFLAPFLFVISRNIKRRLPLLGFAAAWMLVLHLVDIYWFVMPTAEPGEFAPHWLDLASLMGVGGVYFAAVFRLMGSHSLVPVGDPQLERCLEFENA